MLIYLGCGQGIIKAVLGQSSLGNYIFYLQGCYIRFSVNQNNISKLNFMLMLGQRNNEY